MFYKSFFVKSQNIGLKHIIAEITLVCTGILLALAINNWNDKRILDKEINNYILEIDKEIEKAIKYQNNTLKRFEKMSNNLVRSIKIIERNDLDSITTLKQIVWPILTTWPIRYDYPIIQEFIDKDLINKIPKDSLKIKLKLYERGKNSADGMAAFNEKQYLDKVESYVNKNIEYLEIGPQTIFKNVNVNNHPRIETNFLSLYNDLEFWNVLILKTETLLIEISRLKSNMNTFKQIELELKKYIKENKLS